MDIELQKIDFSVIQVQPGDTLVFKFQGFLSEATSNRLLDTIKAKFPRTKALILDNGTELGILRNHEHTANESEFIVKTILDDVAKNGPIASALRSAGDR